MRLHNLSPWLFLSLSVIAPPDVQCTYTAISTKHHQVVFNYLHKQQSERDLPLCEDNRACNVLHKRFWLPPVADRLCRCRYKEECPWKWSDTLDNHTMYLNNRAQLKFCSSTRHLNICSTTNKSLTVEQPEFNTSRPWVDVYVHCMCPIQHYWKYERTLRNMSKIDGTPFTKEEYRCVPLEKCDPQEFCGTVRPNYNSIYYRCSCPTGHLCMFPDTNKLIRKELLFNGPAYSAKCMPFKIPGIEYDF